MQPFKVLIHNSMYKNHKCYLLVINFKLNSFLLKIMFYIIIAFYWYNYTFSNELYTCLSIVISMWTYLTTNMSCRILMINEVIIMLPYINNLNLIFQCPILNLSVAFRLCGYCSVHSLFLWREKEPAWRLCEQII